MIFSRINFIVGISWLAPHLILIFGTPTFPAQGIIPPWQIKRCARLLYLFPIAHKKLLNVLNLKLWLCYS